MLCFTGEDDVLILGGMGRKSTKSIIRVNLASARRFEAKDTGMYAPFFFDCQQRGTVIYSKR